MSDAMPLFPIKATDALAVPALRAYRDECWRHGLSHQAREVQAAIEEFTRWQHAHIDQTKLPDHDHVPAS